MKDIEQQILDLLPHQPPFRFVDKIQKVNSEQIAGTYKIKKDEYFFRGHFPNKEITPGVIIIEVMAQIGLVCHGIYLKMLEDKAATAVMPAFTSTKVDFLAPVYPAQELEVSALKIYFRFNKLKSSISCRNLSSGDLVCQGEFSGMIIPTKNG